MKLDGYKTFIIVGIGVILNGLVAMGYIDSSVIGVANTILGFLGLGALRDGVNKAKNG